MCSGSKPNEGRVSFCFTLQFFYRPVLKKLVLRHSHFPADPWGDGGSKRTAQISEILEDSGITGEFYDPDITRIFQKKFAALEGIKLLNLHKIKSSLSKDALTQLGFNYYKRQKTMDFYARHHHLLLWESNRQQNFLMSYAARDTGLKVIALPHNLESLVSGQKSEFTGRSAPDWFEEELQSLRMCQSIFTISREEQYILKLFGLDAKYLPYFPPREVESFLLKIRENRKFSIKQGNILLLGTAGNKPTFDGMLDRIKFFYKNLRHQGLKLHVAGYLTESLMPHLPGTEQIFLHGSVSNEDLSGLLSTCSMCWIHQVISTGSLTKIPELMMAGVPVLINADAARNFHNIPGIRVYDHDEECAGFLKSEIAIPAVPEKPVSHEKNVVQTITGMLSS